MTVHVILGVISHEGRDILSVWSTREAADAEMAKLTVDPLRDAGGFSNRYDSYEVEEHEVDPPPVTGGNEENPPTGV